MLSDREKEELLADGSSMARRDEFRRAEREASEWIKKRQNRSGSVDEYLDFLEKFQEIISLASLSPPARRIPVSKNLYRL